MTSYDREQALKSLLDQQQGEEKPQKTFKRIILSLLALGAAACVVFSSTPIGPGLLLAGACFALLALTALAADARQMDALTEQMEEILAPLDDREAIEVCDDLRKGSCSKGRALFVGERYLLSRGARRVIKLSDIERTVAYTTHEQERRLISVIVETRDGELVGVYRTPCKEEADLSHIPVLAALQINHAPGLDDGRAAEMMEHDHGAMMDFAADQLSAAWDSYDAGIDGGASGSADGASDFWGAADFGGAAFDCSID